MTDTETAALPVEQIRVRVLPDGRMDRKNTAKYLGRAEKTLAMWALAGKGPRPVNVGGRIFYFIDDCDAYIKDGSRRAPPPEPSRAV